ncbi:protein rep, partial [Vibrio cyclitrophicus]
RFKYQRVAASVLGVDAQKKMQKNDKKHASEIHRVCACTWTAVANNVDLMRSVEHGSGHVKNVATCGSVWSCPVCTAKIQERRRQEIALAMDKWYEQGGQVVMVTLTAPHYNDQSLAELRAMQGAALTSLRKDSGSYRRFLKEDQGFKGLIRALEVTVSNRNGWHLHTHELWFVKGDANAGRIKKRTLERWENACYKAGLLNAFDDKQVRAFRRRSVDIKASASCSEYLAKMDDASHWGADREIAKQSTKHGKKKGSFHPFGLLAEIEEKTDKKAWAAAKFTEYANDMKGARQLFWSPLLKDFFGIGEKSDEEIAAEETATLEKVRSIAKELWYKICKAGARATLLEVIETKDDRALHVFLDQFKGSSDGVKPCADVEHDTKLSCEGVESSGESIETEQIDLLVADFVRTLDNNKFLFDAESLPKTQSFSDRYGSSVRTSTNGAKYV